MTKEVKLDWFGPVNFLTGLGVPYPDDHDRMTDLAKPGIYLLVYPYKKTGIYVGKSKNLIKRHFQHLGYWLNGHYHLMDEEKLDWVAPPPLESPEFSKFIIKAWHEVRKCQTYFATTDNEEMAFYAERAFIEAFQKVIKEKENDFFYEQGVQQTKPSRNSLIFKNKGTQFVQDIFGENVVWQPKI